MYKPQYDINPLESVHTIVCRSEPVTSSICVQYLGNIFQDLLVILKTLFQNYLKFMMKCFSLLKVANGFKVQMPVCRKNTGLQRVKHGLLGMYNILYILTFYTTYVTYFSHIGPLHTVHHYELPTSGPQYN